MYDFTFTADPRIPTRRAELRQAALALLPAFRVGQRVNVPALGLANVEVVAVVPSRTVGGETKYRVRWDEPALGNAERAANFFADELTAWEE